MVKVFLKWKWEQFELGIKPRINLNLIFSVNAVIAVLVFTDGTSTGIN